VFGNRTSVLTAGNCAARSISCGKRWRISTVTLDLICPVVRAGKLELVINLETPKALAFTIPETQLATAGEVIQ
jgi:hypothetical protein